MASPDLIAAVDALTALLSDVFLAPTAEEFGLAWSFGFVTPIVCGIVASAIRLLIDLVKEG